MYLEKLEINGFKSFAKKNTLVFPGMLDKDKWGITAIVGPNGSGKSNIADAVRWVLGEQSMKVLRGKKGEDVIFAGSDKKNKLGLAEVSLFLNNESKRAPIDYSEIILTRRLFRNGDSEYLINNSRARLSDIQIMLAKANVGQKTYSVIGQGMVEGFLNTTLSERKEFFDEATGVRQFQIKRDESLNKLRISYENINQANMLLMEIRPRLNSLTKQVSKLKKRDEIKTELKKLQINYYGKIWHNINNQFSQFNNEFLELEKIKFEKEKKNQQLNNEMNKAEQWGSIGQEFNKAQEELGQLQIQKDKITEQIVKLDAQMEIKLESQGKFDLSWLRNKKTDLEKQTQNIYKDMEVIEKNITNEKSKSEGLQNKKQDIDQQINNLNHILLTLSGENGGRNIAKINGKIKNILTKLKELETQEDIKKIKELIAQIKQETIQLLQLSENTNQKHEINKIHQKLAFFAKDKEKITAEINENYLKIFSQTEKNQILFNERKKTEEELEAINQKLKSLDISKHQDVLLLKQGEQREKEKQNLKQQLSEIDTKINEIKIVISNLSAQEEEKRNMLLSLQKKMQLAQNEINEISNKLNALKINSTKYETKLEDLEIEIRRDLGGLKDVKEYYVKKAAEMAETEVELLSVKADRSSTSVSVEDIEKLKRQLDLIGGIDPEIEKEYTETKERYDFLSGQIEDLTKAINSLEKIIKELDAVIKEKFDKEFKIISEKFEEYFKILFNGGKARIIKVLPEDLKSHTDENHGQDENLTANKDNKDSNFFDINKIKFLQKHSLVDLAGIEIQATPLGKKIQSISMLSGGERALTAIALICAIISANPSPFVVLDEVDAALDEANSERFAKIVDDLSHKTQFIVITHNRASMKRANILYGITMGDDGMSKLLSIKLEDAVGKQNI
ncbi:AAA family ATPase [Patescibacteria group bacterium]|nr:AAA family ATPase [Patescibacteria group bacterium]